jgi:type IV pilus assembly protein PilW
MISITIGLVIMAGVIQLFASSRQTTTTADAASRIQENMRYSMRRIGDDVYRSGIMGCLSFAAAGSPGLADAPAMGGGVESPVGQYIFNRLFFDVAPADGVADTGFQHAVVGVGLARALVAPNLDTNINDFESTFLSGVDNDAVAGNGIADGTDTLIVKYVDTTAAIEIVNATQNQVTVNGNPALTVGDIAVAGNCEGVYVFHIGALGVGGATTTVTMSNDGGNTLTNGIDVTTGSTNFLYVGDSGTYQYYIDDSAAAVALGNVCNPALTPLNCSLFRSENGVASELILGVSGFQVLYGYENNPVLQPNFVAANAAAVLLAAGGAVPNVRLTVDRVQVSLTFNAPDPTQAGGVMSRTYTRVFAVRNQL